MMIEMANASGKKATITHGTRGVRILIVMALVAGLLGGLMGGLLFAAPGPQGEQGPQGVQGEQGPQGEQGIQGARGATGAIGATGATGATGAGGATGPAGIAGETGPQGPAGEIGLPGEQGVQGEQGSAGEPGLPGEQGLNGTNTVQQMIQNQNASSASIGAYNVNTWYSMAVFDSSMNQVISINDKSSINAEFTGSVYLSNSASWFRIVIDNQYYSTICYAGLLGPTAPSVYMPVHLNILVTALSAGEHTIEVQFFRVNGVPTLLDRSLTVAEYAPPP